MKIICNFEKNMLTILITSSSFPNHPEYPVISLYHFPGKCAASPRDSLPERQRDSIKTGKLL
jgi:hypothetical protein